MERLPTKALDEAPAAPQRPRGALPRVLKVATSTAPWLIIGGLLWAGLFIKPQATGATVTPSALERRDFFYGMAAPAPGVLWLAGSNGKIVRSLDGGRHWARQSSPAQVNWQDIAAWDLRHAIVVGNQGLVAVTADAGVSWQLAEAPKSSVANKLTRVITLAQGQAWAVGEMGALLQGSEFGKHWERKRAEEDVGWNDIAFIDERNGWVVGEFGRILRTNDGGASWLPVQAPVASSLMGVAFRDASNGIAVGLEGAILATHDGGASWQQIKSGTSEHLFAVAWDGAKSAWIAAGNQGVWVRGSADGASWQAGRLDARDLAWHTKAVVAEGKVYFAGANVGAFDGQAWQLLTGVTRAPAAEENLPDWGRRHGSGTK